MQNTSQYDKNSVSPPQSGKPLSDFRTNARVLLLAALAVAIGVLSAFVAKGLLWLIAVITNAIFFQRYSAELPSLAHSTLGAWVIVAPAVGALIVGLMARFGSEKIRGHGIPEALEAILLGRSLIKLKVAILKPISSAISIGTGGPFGAEGPIIMTGGAVGSLFAQFFRLTAAERKTLLVSGAAGGMAAVFATPVAAVLLAVELLLFEWKPRSFIPVAVAAIVASAMRVPLLGDGPIFPIPPHDTLGPSALLIATFIGVLGGFASGLLTQIVYFFEDLFEKLPIHWMWWPALGGLFVGLAGYFDPRVLGVGYEYIHELLQGNIIALSAGGLLLAKGIVWAVALGSGTSGGVLAPLLIIGGALGALAGHWFPSVDQGFWAMMGMAAMMGGTMRSPLTGAFFLVELTRDFNALPELFCASAGALAVTVLLLKRSILTEKLARRGQHIAREYSVDVFELMRVGDVMDIDPPLVRDNISLTAFSAQIAKGDPAVSRRQASIVLDAESKLAGIITRGDVIRAQALPGAGEFSVADAATRNVRIAYVDETLHDVIGRLLQQDIGRFPVVTREDPRTVVGYLGRAGILAARQRYYHEEEIRERGFSRESESA